MSPPRIRTVLVVSLGNLSSTVMGTALFRPLKRFFPGVRVGYWVRSFAAGLFEDHSLLDQVHDADPFWDDSPDQPTGTWHDFKSAMRSIKKEHYDAAVILNSDWRLSLACWWMRIPVRIGWGHRGSGFLLSNELPLSCAPHAVDRYLALVQNWAGESLHPELSHPRLETSASEKKWVRGWIEKQHWQKNTLVVCHPFSVEDGRAWPVTWWLNLVQDYFKSHPQTRFVFVCGQREGVRLVEALHLVPRGSTLVLAGAPMSQVKAVMSSARLFVGGGSGPAHMAAALGRPVISIIGTPGEREFAPRGHGPIRELAAPHLPDLSIGDVVSEMESLLRQSGGNSV